MFCNLLSVMWHHVITLISRCVTVSPYLVIVCVITSPYTVSSYPPYSAISVELYYIFATVWGREAYTLYGILFLVFVILISVTACISVALTYHQLSSEDYRWWWKSIFSSG